MEDYWLVEITDRCSGIGCDEYHYGHHPLCGVDLVDDADEALSPSSMWDFSNVPVRMEVLRKNDG